MVARTVRVNIIKNVLIIVMLNINNSSTVAEMGNHLATIDMGRKLDGMPLWGGELGQI